MEILQIQIYTMALKGRGVWQLFNLISEEYFLTLIYPDDYPAGLTVMKVLKFPDYVAEYMISPQKSLYIKGKIFKCCPNFW